jgi:hypothetical protein
MSEPKCDVCGDTGYYPIHDRFGREWDRIACPAECETSLEQSRCQIDGCKNPATIGTPTEDGYKWLCSAHGQPYLKGDKP